MCRATQVVVVCAGAFRAGMLAMRFTRWLGAGCNLARGPPGWLRSKGLCTFSTHSALRGRLAIFWLPIDAASGRSALWCIGVPADALHQSCNRGSNRGVSTRAKLAHSTAAKLVHSQPKVPIKWINGPDTILSLAAGSAKNLRKASMVLRQCTVCRKVWQRLCRSWVGGG